MGCNWAGKTTQCGLANQPPTPSPVYFGDRVQVCDLESLQTISPLDVGNAAIVIVATIHLQARKILRPRTHHQCLRFCGLSQYAIIFVAWYTLTTGASGHFLRIRFRNKASKHRLRAQQPALQHGRPSADLARLLGRRPRAPGRAAVWHLRAPMGPARPTHRPG